jgi:carbon-monoxide dehydrogenase medium subunit
MPVTFEALHWSRFIQVGDYHLPATLAEALELLARYEGQARVVAGGTDVMVQLRKQDYGVGALVDVSRLPDLDDIRAEGDTVSIGSLVTHARAAGSDLIQDRAPVLAEGCASVGSPQIRNVATLAGNLVSGQPAADASIPLLALDARVTIASGEGQRVVPLSEFFVDLGRTALDPTREIMTRIEFEGLGPNEGSAHLRLAKRKALALPMLVCAVTVRVDPAQQAIDRARIALGPVAPVPWRERDTERMLEGAPLSRETLARAAESATAQCRPRDSLLRGSCDYRTEMVKVFVRRGLAQALAAAGHPVS